LSVPARGRFGRCGGHKCWLFSRARSPRCSWSSRRSTLGPPISLRTLRPHERRSRSRNGEPTRSRTARQPAAKVCERRTIHRRETWLPVAPPRRRGAEKTWFLRRRGDWSLGRDESSAAPARGRDSHHRGGVRRTRSRDYDRADIVMIRRLPSVLFSTTPRSRVSHRVVMSFPADSCSVNRARTQTDSTYPSDNITFGLLPCPRPGSCSPR